MYFKNHVNIWKLTKTCFASFEFVQEIKCLVSKDEKRGKEDVRKETQFEKKKKSNDY